MDKKFVTRARWFLEEVRKGVHPSANDLAREFDVSPKTATRLIDRLRTEYEAPLEYNSGHKGYELSDPAFRLPCNCSLSAEELEALQSSVKHLESNGSKEVARVLQRLVERLGG